MKTSPAPEPEVPWMWEGVKAYLERRFDDILEECQILGKARCLGKHYRKI